MRLGASDYLIKTCSKKAMLSSITRCLKHKTVRKHKSKTNINTLMGQKPLTKRELEVCSYLVNGMSDKSMADKLSVSVPTVKFHLQNIYKNRY